MPLNIRLRALVGGDKATPVDDAVKACVTRTDMKLATAPRMNAGAIA
jgi:hypothetical protein